MKNGDPFVVTVRSGLFSSHIVSNLFGSSEFRPLYTLCGKLISHKDVDSGKLSKITCRKCRGLYITRD